MKASVGILVCLVAMAVSVDARPWSAADRRAGHFCDTTRGPAGAEVARHVDHLRRMEMAGRPVQFESNANRDYGNIAAIEATVQSGILPDVNLFDLKQRSLKFKRNADKTYSVQFVTTTFDGSTGTKVDLTDDDSELIDLGFAFPFFGKSFTSLYLNTDGNFTMGQGDNQSSPRNFTRFNALARIGPLFDDLNPEQGGEVDVAKLADRVVVTWNNVPEWDETQILPPNRFQAVLFKNGDIQFNYSDTLTPQKAIVGITPSLTGNQLPQIADYTVDAPITPVAGAIGEVFSTTREVDYYSIIRSFLATHPDSFDSILIFTSSRDIQIIAQGQGAWAFESSVKNDIRGIGLEVYDFSDFVGSTGRFRSIVVMDYLGRFPLNPYQIIPQIGENNTVSVMGQEVGHLWLAFPHILENGAKTGNLLGRDDAHWSFNFDSDASVMEGNDIRDNGNGMFTTVATVDRYSLLDQYIIGLQPSWSVPDSFYVANTGIDPGTGPRTGITLTGTRVNVNIGQIIAAEGARSPTWDKAQHVFNEAFVLLVKSGQQPAASDLTKLETIRTAWTSFFKTAVDSHGIANTALTGGTFSGTVTDKKGKPLAGIPVSISLNGYGLVWTATSGADGTYSLKILQPGSYQLLAKRGTKQSKKSGKIVGTETVTVDFKMK